MRRSIPPRTQFASPELINEIVHGQRAVIDDPRWRESGASTLEEYALWARSGCGMACLQMLLEETGMHPPPLVELARGCEAYGGYRRRQDVADRVDGLFYKEFVAYVRTEFGLDARVAAPLTLDELMANVTRGDLVLASVHRDIRWPSSQPAVRGGHLVLVFGVDDEALVFNNPSGHRPGTQHNVRLPRTTFAKFYAERGISVKLSTGTTVDRGRHAAPNIH